MEKWAEKPEIVTGGAEIVSVCDAIVTVCDSIVTDRVEIVTVGVEITTGGGENVGAQDVNSSRDFIYAFPSWSL